MLGTDGFAEGMDDTVDGAIGGARGRKRGGGALRRAMGAVGKSMPGEGVRRSNGKSKKHRR